jgi:hypothetical protein
LKEGEERGCVPRSGISRSNLKRSKNITSDWNRAPDCAAERGADSAARCPYHLPSLLVIPAKT